MGWIRPIGLIRPICQTTGVNIVTPSEAPGVVAGDSIAVDSPYTGNGATTGTRLDLIFRIDPGPGNYTVKGDRTSALVNRDPVHPFFASYLANNGAFDPGVTALMPAPTTLPATVTPVLTTVPATPTARPAAAPVTASTVQPDSATPAASSTATRFIRAPRTASSWPSR